jgi:pyridoxine 4-dehydrogenase
VYQIALAWLLARSPAMLVIPGTSSMRHLEENIRAVEIRLTEEDLGQL